MNKNLLILCDSAYGTVVREIALSMGCFEKVDEYHEISVGKLEDYEKFTGTYSYAIAAFEDSQTRMAWSDKLIEAGFAIISLVSPKAYVSPTAQINQGCIIEPLAGVNSNVSVGACSIIKMGALINHNSVVSEGGCCENYRQAHMLNLIVLWKCGVPSKAMRKHRKSVMGITKNEDKYGEI